MAEAGDGSGHTPLTPEWTPAPRASHYPWQGDRPAAAPSLVCSSTSQCWCKISLKSDVVCQSYGNVHCVIVFSWTRCRMKK